MGQQQWLRDYQAQGEAMVRRSLQFQQQLQELSETATSGDGSFSVTVNPSGALRDIVFTSRVRPLPEAELARLIVQTAQQAHARIAHRIAELVEPVSGDTEALAFLRGQLPPLTDEPRQDPTRDQDDRDDDDFTGTSFLR